MEAGRGVSSATAAVGGSLPLGGRRRDAAGPPASASAAEGGDEVGEEVDMANRATGDPRGEGEWRRRRGSS
jgi:hypothetical protein